jgi:hypothetical protein
MDRRTFLAALLAAPFASVALPRERRAGAQPNARLRSVARDAKGTTLWLGLDHAPFPVPGGGYTDDTVIVFVPAQFRFYAEEGLAALVHFHGHNTGADHAIVQHQLREQMVDSRQNALLIVPQLAVSSADSACGKLEAPRGLAAMLEEAIAVAHSEAHATLGDSVFPGDARLGTVCVSAHSGGYHAAACAVRNGGVDIRELYLFDALYADLDVFRDWVLARRGEPSQRRHKLVSFSTEGAPTDTNGDLLRSELEHAGLNCVHEMQEGEMTRHDLSHADAVFVRTGLWHSNVTWETNALRDCLFASVLPRHLPSLWFARKGEARDVERRR